MKSRPGKNVIALLLNKSINLLKIKTKQNKTLLAPNISVFTLMKIVNFVNFIEFEKKVKSETDAF